MSILNCTPNGREMSGTLAAKNAFDCIFRTQGVASRSPIRVRFFRVRLQAHCYLFKPIGKLILKNRLKKDPNGNVDELVKSRKSPSPWKGEGRGEFE